MNKKYNNIIYDDLGILVIEALGRDGVSCTFVLDSQDRDLLNLWWRIDWNGYPTNITWIKEDKVSKCKHTKLHRVISARMNNGVPYKLVDHHNRDKTDCRRENIRSATNTQNAANRTPNKNTVSCFRGVSRNGNRWRARVIFHRESYYAGTFDTEIEAAKACDELGFKLHGEFYTKNFRT